MKEIDLGKNTVALVDDADYELVSQYKWHLNNLGYAFHKSGSNNFSMHRFLMNAQKGHILDHANGNRVDNRRANLRFVTRQQNAFNKRTSKNNTSGYKGVSWAKAANKWAAYIQVDRRFRYLGVRDDPKDAARLYNEAAIEAFGQYASLNIIE